MPRQYDAIKVKDQLGRPQDIAILPKRKEETLIIEELPVKVETKTIGNSFILGHPTNGILGTATGVGGSQIVLGEDSRVTTIQAIVNLNKLYREYFRYDTFKDTSNTTADWDSTTDYQLEMTTGEIGQSLSVAKNNGTINKATMTISLASGVIGDLTLQLSADGGSNFENVTNTTEHTFTNSGVDLIWKITATGTVDINKITIQYG